MTGVLPVTVVIPTIGRPQQLSECLNSLSSADPRAGQILIVDQSSDPAVADLVDRHRNIGAIRIPCQGPGKAIGTNTGLRHATNEIVMMTDDDCTVAPTWIGVGWRLMTSEPTAIFTGRVLPAGNPDAVPSTVADVVARDYTGELEPGALYWGNVACSKTEVLDIGGFEERMTGSAADNDFCYRWLRDGRTLRFEPELVVWHHDWRTAVELRAVYVKYARGQGMFYAKHLRAGDGHMLRFIGRDLYLAARGTAGRLIRPGRSHPEWTDGVLRGLPAGLYDGWRTFRRDARAS